MKNVKKLLGMTTLALSCATISACGQPEPPRTVSDFCLNDRRVSIEIEPAVGAEDAVKGNDFDTDETVTEVLTHNQVYDRLCVKPEP